MTDVSYIMDLKTRTVEVSSGCCEDFNFKGTFEEAIRHYAFKDYSEKDVLSKFPKESDIQKFFCRATIDGFWEIIRSVNKEIPQLEYDIYEHRIIEIGDNPRFYLSQDFIHYPSCKMNENYKAEEDAMVNVQRIGLITYFKNTVSQKDFTLNYMIRLTKDGYILPLTEEYIPYTQEISEDVKKLELKMLHGILSDSKLQEIREALEKRDNE